MTENEQQHVQTDLSQPHVQAAIDRVRAEVKDLARLIREHRAAGCDVADCPSRGVLARISAVGCAHRYDLLVGALIALSERDQEIERLRAELAGKAGA